MAIDKKYIIIGGIVLVLLIASQSAKASNNSEIMKTSFLRSGYVRGIRNNNPLNLKYSSSRDYMGKISLSENTDKVHEQFESMVFGLAAAISHMTQRYINGSGWSIKNCEIPQKTFTAPFNTLTLIANVWAPSKCDPSAGLPGGNNPAAYIKFVSAKSGINPDEKLNASDKETLKKLIWGMCLYENGAHFENTIFSWANWNLFFNAAWSII